MELGGLSWNERLTLYGLVRHPELSDRLLSRVLGLKSPTLTAARRKLRSEGWYRVVRVPILGRLGGELLCVARARLNICKPREALLRAMKGPLAEIGSVFFAIADRLNLICLSMCTNFTQAWSDSERLHSLLTERGALAPGSAGRPATILPLSHMSLVRFLDFASTAHYSLGIQGPPPEPASPTDAGKDGPVHLSRVERAVYCGLVKFPELSDRALAKKVGVARQSVSRIRRRLGKAGLLLTVAVPDIRRLGPEILALWELEFRPATSVGERAKAIEGALRAFPAFLHLISGREGVVMGLVKDFSALQRIYTEFLKIHLDKGYFTEEPRLTPLSIRELSVVKDFTFAPIVEWAVGAED
ncbi:MAG: Lrp/AsnC family transcriptional regulator [Thermoplasmata archaeon]